MTIRDARENDLDGLLRLYTQLHDNPMPDKSEGLLALWQDILRDRNHHIIVAADGDRIVSSCMLLIVPNLTRGQRPYALIENVVTALSHRKRGLASACLNYAREIARRHNCYKMMLMTGSKEDSTLSFYRSAGYNSEDKTALVQWL